MEPVERICPHCHAANPVEALYCGACATRLRSASTALVPRGRAALARRHWRQGGTALALGAAALAGRLAMELLRRPELIETALRALRHRGQHAPVKEAPLAPPRRPTVVVRRTWVVGDASGPKQWGAEEIEVHHPE